MHPHNRAMAYPTPTSLHRQRSATRHHVGSLPTPVPIRPSRAPFQKGESSADGGTSAAVKAPSMLQSPIQRSKPVRGRCHGVCICSKCCINSAFTAIGRHHCMYCKKSFSRPYRLQMHIRASHQNIRPFSCTKCPRSYPDRSRLNEHLKKSHGIISRPRHKRKTTTGAESAGSSAGSVPSPN